MSIDNSSSRLDSFLADGKMEEVAAILGHPYQISGVVQHGDKRGRTIGFPTANLLPRTTDDCPGIGVYAGSALGTAAAISVGVRPTIGDGHTVRVEVHLLDFSQDLYGTVLDVLFLSKIRGERKFPNLDALSAQLQRDVDAARQIWTAATFT
jgi:riboflavin kinase/FMN adenylyltransferase